jgi:hypothetical protein
MKLCIEGDIYFIPKFHILEIGTVKLSIETGLTTNETPLICSAPSRLAVVIDTKKEKKEISITWMMVIDDNPHVETMQNFSLGNFKKNA